MSFTKEEKENALLAFGWQKQKGYPMNYEAPESDNIFVPVEEVRKWVGEPAQDFWNPDGDWEYLRDFEDAWEYLYDELFNELDTDDDRKVDEHIRKRINGER